jgi:hypothetical protein
MGESETLPACSPVFKAPKQKGQTALHEPLAFCAGINAVFFENPQASCLICQYNSKEGPCSQIILGNNHFSQGHHCTGSLRQLFGL